MHKNHSRATFNWEYIGKRDTKHDSRRAQEKKKCSSSPIWIIIKTVFLFLWTQNVGQHNVTTLTLCSAPNCSFGGRALSVDCSTTCRRPECSRTCSLHRPGPGHPSVLGRCPSRPSTGHPWALFRRFRTRNRKPFWMMVRRLAMATVSMCVMPGQQRLQWEMFVCPEEWHCPPTSISGP